jgi:cell wall assembly regulator SMI1
MWIVLILSIIVFGICIAYFAALRGLREFFYPKPMSLPMVVDKSLEDVLRDLDTVLSEKVPSVAIRLQAGLSSREIDELEKKAGIKLNDELRTLYIWHNGCQANENQNFIPGHIFLPLDAAIEQYIICKQQLKSAPLLQRIAFNIFAGHRKNWITIFDDLCGDGYFYDPDRNSNEGCVFYHFSEGGYYFFFPSLKNLLTAITECYRQGAYFQKSGSNLLEKDYEHSEKIFADFGTACW